MQEKHDRIRLFPFQTFGKLTINGVDGELGDDSTRNRAGDDDRNHLKIRVRRNRIDESARSGPRTGELIDFSAASNLLSLELIQVGFSRREGVGFVSESSNGDPQHRVSSLRRALRV